MNPPVRLSFKPRRPSAHDGHLRRAESVFGSNASVGYGEFRSSSRAASSVASATARILCSSADSSSPKKCTPSVASSTSTTSDVRTPLRLSTSPWNGPQKSPSVSRHFFSPFATSSSASSKPAVNP